MKTPTDVLRAWAAAYDARDPHALIALYHDEAVNHQVAFGPPISGREVLLRSFEEFFRAFPDTLTGIENIFEDGEWGIIEWLGSGTFIGALGGHAPTGRSFTLRGCGFFHIVDGLIRFQRGYIDKQTWFDQIGLSMTDAVPQV